MEKIRIGNDIRLLVNLTGSKNIDAVNIHSVEAYLINTTKWMDLNEEHFRESAMMHDEMECRKHKIRFVSRFPVEPWVFGHHYCPNPHDICCSGRPCYHVHPIPFVPVYPGFGVHPHTFEPHTWCRDDMHDLFDRAMWKNEDLQHGFDRCRYLAPVESTESKNVIKVYFPAKAQLYTGRYKLLLVVKLYDPGYCKHNLRTVTIDYKDVFELVGCSEEGQEGDVMITIGDSKTATSINILGDTEVRTGGTGDLTATVYPTDLANNGVDWQIVSGAEHVSLVPMGNNKCRIMGTSEGVAVIRAISVATPSVYNDIPVTISDNAKDSDVYVDNVTFSVDASGQQSTSRFTVDRNDGQNLISLDTTPYTEWYEGN